MRRLASRLLCLALASWVLTVVPPSAAEDTVPLDVGLTDYEDLLVDEDHGRVFISQGSDTIVVTDLDGKPLAPITGLPGSAGMSLDDDGSTLWVAVEDADELAAIDTTTLEVTTYPIGVDTCPVDVALTSGLVWVYAGCYYGYGDLYALDPASGSVTLVQEQVSRPFLTTSPELPGRLFVVPRNDSPGSIRDYDVTGLPTPALTLRAEVRDDDNTSYGRANLVVLPGGQHLVTGSGVVLDTADLSVVSKIQRRFGWAAVARRADGMLAFGGGDGISLLNPGSSSTYRDYTFYGRWVGGRALVWGTTKLYAVTYVMDYPDRNFRLRVITPRRTSSLTVTTPKNRYTWGERVPVTASLAGGVTNRQVAIYTQTAPYDGPRVLVARGTVDANGRFTTHHRADRRARFFAVYAGDSATDGSADQSAEVYVKADVDTAMLRFRSRRGPAFVYRSSDTAVMRVTVRPNHANECVSVDVQLKFGRRWRWGRGLDCAKLSTRSVAKVALRGSKELVAHPVRLRVRSKGSTASQPTQTPWVYVTFVR